MHYIDIQSFVFSRVIVKLYFYWSCSHFSELYVILARESSTVLFKYVHLKFIVGYSEAHYPIICQLYGVVIHGLYAQNEIKTN